MDSAVGHYLDSLGRELTASHAIACASGDLSEFMVSPFDTTCVQGHFSCAARAFAQRGRKVFFLAYDTQQYGVGIWDGAESGSVRDADQYLTPEAALKRFLGEDPAAD
jgi:hypothetical protein